MTEQQITEKAEREYPEIPHSNADYFPSHKIYIRGEYHKKLSREAFTNGYKTCMEDMKGEAIEFARWMDEAGFNKSSNKDNSWVSFKTVPRVFTIEQLYTQFKQREGI